MKCIFKEKKHAKDFNPDTVSDFIMERFSNSLNSYTKSFNKVYKRKGALFIDYLRRVEIKHDSQFGATIFYIHKNAVHHGLCKSIPDWPWSSYHSFFVTGNSLILREEVLEWFGGEGAFVQYHQQPIFLKDAVVIE